MKPQLKEYAYPAIIEFIKNNAKNMDCVIVGLSGGIDSAVVSKLCCDALGPEKVINLILPSSVSSKKDIADASRFCEQYGMKYQIITLDPIIDTYSSILDLNDPVLKGNIMARSRMTILFNYAHALNGIVMGTGNKSELLIGYFTKYGDGGVDFLPIGDLYKTEVRELAVKIGVPEEIILKSPSAGLYAGQTDESELGISYDALDEILYGLEQSKTNKEISIETGIDLDIIDSIIERNRKSIHKRKTPLIPKLGIRTIGCDWRE